MSKKQKILCAVGSAIVVIAVAIALVFVFSGKNSEPQVNLEGTWVVGCDYNNGSLTFPEKQFMVFTKDSVTVYKDGSTTPFAQSAYSIDGSNQMKVPALSREYNVVKRTDNCYALYQNGEQYIILIRNSSDELIEESVDSTILTGKWNVVMKGDQFNNGEVLNFVDNKLEYFKTPGEAASIVADYVITDGKILTVDEMNFKVKCYYLDDNTVLFVQDGETVWELSRVTAE